MQSVHISALSRPLCFFSFLSPCFTDLFDRVRKVRESLKLLLLPKVSHDWPQRKKRRDSIKPCTLWRSAHLLHETSCPWFYTQAHPSYFLINVRLQEHFKRRHSKLVQVIFSRSISTLLHYLVRVSIQTRDFAHFKLLKLRKGTFTISSQILSKNCFWGKIMQTRAPISAPSSAANFSLASKSKTIHKRLSKPFDKSLLTNILTTSASTSSPPFAIYSVLTVIFDFSKRWKNFTPIRSWKAIDVKSLEVYSVARCKSRLSNS